MSIRLLLTDISMNPEDFSTTSAGKVISTPKGYWVFIPAPLPPELNWNSNLASRVGEAERALRELAWVGRNFPEPHIVVRSFIRQEAVMSSRIEGTHASLDDLYYYETDQSSFTDPADVREVRNYVIALDHGLSRLETLPVSLRLIRELHQHLMEDVRGGIWTPGEFRRTQNWIGPPGCTLMEATFVPPPSHEMEEAMSQLEKYLHVPSSLPPLVKYALVHYQFEVIHPFLDGNGRIGRLLITLLLCLEGILPQPLLYLSAYFEKNREEYYRLLLAVSQTGAWSELIIYFLRGVKEQSRDALKRSNRLILLQQEFRQKLQTKRSSALSLRLSDELFQYPAITAAQVSEKFKITPRAAQQNIQKLIGASILKEATGKQRNRVYIAEAIIKIIEADLV